MQRTADAVAGIPVGNLYLGHVMLIQSFTCNHSLVVVGKRSHSVKLHVNGQSFGYRVDSLVQTQCICNPSEFEDSQLEEGLAETAAGIQRCLIFPRVRLPICTLKWPTPRRSTSLRASLLACIVSSVRRPI